ncbi:MAG TPA: 2-octaprenyl-3-methyl-6-methoxy-1,4-benzoquinol hydroxylase [Thiothrix sp.]|nr:2-octaprenyl-3-methyl-6-methoxy-1,4-benzoquinol hydroxylase [Thiothrix sp.]
MVGATLGCLLAKQGCRVAIVEPYVPAPFSLNDAYGLRVSAISRASQHALMQAGAWSFITDLRMTPYEAMCVWDATGHGEIHFSAADIGEPDLGAIIENQVIQAGLSQAMDSYDNLAFLAPVSVDACHYAESQIAVELSSGKTVTTALLVGADGAYSKVRTLAGIDVQKNDYNQKGLVAVVRTEKAHQLTAWQRFMPSGPLAFLPLNEGKSSIVWTLPADKADYYLAMSDDAFNVAITAAFDQRLGNVRVVSQRVAFPLMGQQAEHYIAEGIALVGDAAHTIHPLAGQGVNLGIKDAVALAEVFVSAKKVDNSPFSLKALRRYERARRGDNVLTQKAMEGFKLLFGNTFIPLQFARNMGLSAVNKVIPVKNEIMRRAMGL